MIDNVCLVVALSARNRLARQAALAIVRGGLQCELGAHRTCEVSALELHGLTEAPKWLAALGTWASPDSVSERHVRAHAAMLEQLAVASGHMLARRATSICAQTLLLVGRKLQTVEQ